MTQSLRKQVYAAIMRQEPAWFGKTSTGELVNRLSADTQLVGRNLSQNVSDGLRSLFMVGAGTGMMVRYVCKCFIHSKPLAGATSILKSFQLLSEIFENKFLNNWYV